MIIGLPSRTAGVPAGLHHLKTTAQNPIKPWCLIYCTAVLPGGAPGGAGILPCVPLQKHIAVSSSQMPAEHLYFELCIFDAILKVHFCFAFLLCWKIDPAPSNLLKPATTALDCKLTVLAFDTLTSPGDVVRH